MDDASDAERLRLAFEQPLGELVRSGDRVDVAAGGWDLPAADRVALASFGLPLMDPTVIPAFQANPQQGNVPSAQFRDRSFYLLGLLNGMEIGATPGSGIVFGLPLDPLGHLFLVNSTVASFVELVWRFYHFLPIVHGVEVDPTLFDRLDRFWAVVRAVDPRVDLDRSISLWQAIVEEWM